MVNISSWRRLGLVLKLDSLLPVTCELGMQTTRLSAVTMYVYIIVMFSTTPVSSLTVILSPMRKGLVTSITMPPARLDSEPCSASPIVTPTDAIAADMLDVSKPRYPMYAHSATILIILPSHGSSTTRSVVSTFFLVSRLSNLRTIRLVTLHTMKSSIAPIITLMPSVVIQLHIVLRKLSMSKLIAFNKVNCPLLNINLINNVNIIAYIYVFNQYC